MCHGIDHFTVECLVTWPLNESEAEVDLALIETTAFLMLMMFSCLIVGIWRFSIKGKSTPASLSFEDQVTKLTTEKWSMSVLKGGTSQ